MNARSLFIEIIAYAFILLFLYAGVYKLLDVPLFEPKGSGLRMGKLPLIFDLHPSPQ